MKGGDPKRSKQMKETDINPSQSEKLLIYRGIIYVYEAGSDMI